MGKKSSYHDSSETSLKIAYACRDTNLGPVLMGAAERGVCCVLFAEDARSLNQQLREAFPRAKLVAASAQVKSELEGWMEALADHLSGNAPRPELPLDLRGTPFQMKVWRTLLDLREGETVGYGQVAERIGQPRAARAVGSACAANRIGVLVPCHLVVRSDGSAGAYRWGSGRKQALIDSARSRAPATAEQPSRP